MSNGQAAAPSDRITGFHVRVLVLLILALMTDSYDLQAASFAAPELAKAWGVPSSEFGLLFAAGLAGVFVGALALGWFGDRFGRRRAIVLACIFYGGFSLLSTLATNATEFTVLRFLMGIGCGGALPNVVALATELAPERRRGMLTSLIFVGMPLGGAIPGYVTSWWVPDFGWQIIFLIGGVAPILFASIIWFALPESPAFLAARHARAHAQSSTPEARTKPTFFKLLSRELWGTTLLLWLMFAAALMTIYLVASWLPLVLREGGVSAAGTANISLLHALGGAASGLALGLVIDRIGLGSVVAFFILSLLSVILVAFSDLSESGLLLTIFFCGFAVTGVQYALNVSAGLIYPAEVRSSGVGAALGIGRAGSVFGAMLGGPIRSGTFGATLGLFTGGAINAETFSGLFLFLVPVPVLIIGTIAAIILMRVRTVRVSASGPEARVSVH